MARITKKASMNKEEQKDFAKLSERLGISNDSDLLKKAIRLANHYCDFIEKLVPQEVFQAYLDKLHYTKTVGKKQINKGKIWEDPK